VAYRKTEKVLAQLEAKRNSIIASAIDVIGKSGMDGLTTDAVAERAGISNGLIYNYFPDKTELLAAVVAKCLERDLAAMKEASITGDLPGAISALASRLVLNYVPHRPFPGLSRWHPSRAGAVDPGERCR